MNEITQTYKPIKNIFKNNLEIILSIATEVTNVDVCIVGEHENVPPILTLKPCVYIIMEEENKWYCGETKNIIERRRQHKQKKRFGNIFIYPMKDKTVALNCETLIQRKCIESSIPLTSYTDSKHNI
jgi:predicted GIY-YIG superfamily endonuclease